MGKQRFNQQACSCNLLRMNMWIEAFISFEIEKPILSMYGDIIF